MMTERQLIERLLELLEHPELMGDEQLRQALDDPKTRELVEQMAFAKRAFKNEELQEQECDIEEEWSKFAAKHFDEESDVLPLPAPRRGVRSGGTIPYKIAASFIGLVVVSGIAFAAIHFIQLNRDPKPQTVKTEQPVSNDTSPVLTKDTIKTDTIITTTQDTVMEPVVFENVRLDEMLPRIASFYHTEVMFQNEAARELRFHFVWKHKDGLEHAIEKLNRFESLTIRLEEGGGENQSTKIIVE